MDDDVKGLQAIFDIVRATYSCATVAWFGGDDDDPPGWRAFALDSRGLLYCVGAPPRLSQGQALRDCQYISWHLHTPEGREAYALGYYHPPEGWPDRQYGQNPADCGPSSAFGMDIPESQADAWATTVHRMMAEATV